VPIPSNNPAWQAFGARALARVIYGGADIAECFSTFERISNGTAENWYREWTNTAERVFAIARTCEQAGHLISAREAYFRAATYYHVSYFPLFGFPVDPWLADAFERETDAFHCAAKLGEFPIESVEVPFETASLPGYFLCPSHYRLTRPTLLHVNSDDSNIQEMYFGHGPAAVRRGYNCLLLDGPGQGRNLIRDNSSLRPDWETVVRAAVDYLLTRPEVNPKQIVLAGWGFGGFLAPRAAAFEKRIAALIADPGLWDQEVDLKTFHLSPEVIARFPHFDPALFSSIEKHLRSPNVDPMTRWRILQRSFWVHGVDSMYDLALKLREFTISGVSDRISCPTLITMSEGDPQSAQAKRLYSALRCPKDLVHFTAAEGAGGHCESLSRSLYHQRIFDWLDDTLRVSSELSPLGTLSLLATGKEEVYAYKSTTLSGE
jgi:pimeloyl-ACP methyl ester carboxylesterase